MAKEKTYRITVTCTNCGENQSEVVRGEVCLLWFHIPKGQFVSDFLANKKCKNCGCQYLRRKQ